MPIALGFSERQAVKTLIFGIDTCERVLVVLGGNPSVISGHLQKAIGPSRMADPGAVREKTGYVIGFIPQNLGRARDGIVINLDRSRAASVLDV